MVASAFVQVAARSVRAAPRATLSLLVAVALGGVIIPAPAAAQTPAASAVVVGDTLQEIRLADGSTLVGRVVAVEGGRVSIETTGGVRIEVERAQIRSLRPVQGTVRGGEFWFDDPNQSRLFFGPTGRLLRGGEGYLGVFELFFPFVSYGVSDHLTLAGGTPVIPEVIGRAVYLAPKLGMPVTPRVHLAAGVLALFSTDDWDTDNVGILYGVGTFGSPDDALTLGAGWPFYSGDLAQRPVLLVGGETRLHRRAKLITENYLVTYRDEVGATPAGGAARTRTRTAGLLSGGVRFLGERLSADAGLGVLMAGDEGFCCLPLVNFVYNFGHGR